MLTLDKSTIRTGIFNDLNMLKRKNFNNSTLSLVILFLLYSPTIAFAWDTQPTNPFPGVAYGAEIPGYTLERPCTPDGDCGIGIVPVISCPPWSAADGRDGYSTGVAKRFCRNSWTPPTSAADDEDFRNREKLAIAQATSESQAWNAAQIGRAHV